MIPITIKDFTVKELTDHVTKGSGKPVTIGDATGFLNIMEAMGRAQRTGKRPSESGKGKPSTLWTLTS